jgi:hypothetical protein
MRAPAAPQPQKLDSLEAEEEERASSSITAIIMTRRFDVDHQELFSLPSTTEYWEYGRRQTVSLFEYFKQGLSHPPLAVNVPPTAARAILPYPNKSPGTWQRAERTSAVNERLKSSLVGVSLGTFPLIF